MGEGLVGHIRLPDDPSAVRQAFFANFDIAVAYFDIREGAGRRLVIGQTPLNPPFFVFAGIGKIAVAGCRSHQVLVFFTGYENLGHFRADVQGEAVRENQAVIGAEQDNTLVRRFNGIDQPLLGFPGVAVFQNSVCNIRGNTAIPGEFAVIVEYRAAAYPPDNILSVFELDLEFELAERLAVFERANQRGPGRVVPWCGTRKFPPPETYHNLGIRVSVFCRLRV